MSDDAGRAIQAQVRWAGQSDPLSVDVRGAQEHVLVVTVPKPLPDDTAVSIGVRAPPAEQWTTGEVVAVWQQQTGPQEFSAGLGLVSPSDAMRATIDRALGGRKTTPDARVELFRDVRLFEEFGEDDLRLLCSVCLRRALAKGETFFHQGTAATGANGLFFVEGGLIRIFHEDARGVEETLWTASAGQVFGEMSLWRGESHSASIRAVTDSALMVLEPAGLRFLKRHHREVAIKLLEVVIHMLCDRLGRTTKLLFSPSRLG